MLFLMGTMCVILALAALVVVYVAYPHRGADVPGAPWLGQALRRGVDAMPTLDEHHSDRVVSQRR